MVPSIFDVELPKNCPLRDIVEYEKRFIYDKIASAVVNDLVDQAVIQEKKSDLLKCLDLILTENDSDLYAQQDVPGDFEAINKNLFYY